MIGSILLIVAGLGLLVGGGELLLRGAVGLATLLRLTPSVIGLTVVAAGTSLPELSVSAIAAARGSTDLAVSNVVGVNIFNVAVILGLCAVVRPLTIDGNTIKLEYPFVLLVSMLALVLIQDGVISRLDGAFAIAVYVAFTAYLVSLVRQQVTTAEASAFREEVSALTPTSTPHAQSFASPWWPQESHCCLPVPSARSPERWRSRVGWDCRNGSLA